jgi:hypothetical protein
MSMIPHNRSRGRSSVKYHFVSYFSDTLHSGTINSTLKLSSERSRKRPCTAGGQLNLKFANMERTCKKSCSIKPTVKQTYSQTPIRNAEKPIFPLNNQTYHADAEYCKVHAPFAEVHCNRYTCDDDQR